MDRPGAQGPRGSQQTGSDRPCGLPAPPPAAPRKRDGRGRRLRRQISRDAPSGRAPAPLLRPSFPLFPLPVVDLMAGGLGGAVTPVPFPNTDVKGPRGDGTTPRSVGEQRAAGLPYQAPSLLARLGAFFFSRHGRRGGRPSPGRPSSCRDSFYQYIMLAEEGGHEDSK